MSTSARAFASVQLVAVALNALDVMVTMKVGAVLGAEELRLEEGGGAAPTLCVAGVRVSKRQRRQQGVVGGRGCEMRNCSASRRATGGRGVDKTLCTGQRMGDGASAAFTHTSTHTHTHT